MPGQNRVTPFGGVVAVPDRGTLMGNRGVLHDAEGAIRRPWQLRRWILCVLQFKGRKRQILMPGRYTELFFLDEATGLAAGHRPCAECQRERFLAFRAAWATRDPRPGGRLPSAVELDGQLHSARVGPDRTQRRHEADLDGLPDGVFVTLKDDGPAHLVWGGVLLAWTAGGYRERRKRPAGEMVTVLTPAPTVAAIRAGYTPAVHPSAG